MLWWIVGIVAVWVVLGALAAVWIGRAISHANLEEEAAELRRTEKHSERFEDPDLDDDRVERDTRGVVTRPPQREA